MLTTEQINDLHRLYWSEHWSIRKIERHLKMCWKTIKKYLDAPAQGTVKRQRISKLDPFKDQIAEWLEKDPHASAAVIEQRLRPLGYGPEPVADAIEKAAGAQAFGADYIARSLQTLGGDRVDEGQAGLIRRG